jgi:hypothetical protein
MVIDLKACLNKISVMVRADLNGKMEVITKVAYIKVSFMALVNISLHLIIKHTLEISKWARWKVMARRSSLKMVVLMKGISRRVESTAMVLK